MKPQTNLPPHSYQTIQAGKPVWLLKDCPIIFESKADLVCHYKLLTQRFPESLPLDKIPHAIATLILAFIAFGLAAMCFI